MNFIQKISAVLCLSAILFGCSLAAIGGRYADWYVMRRIDRFVDLSKDQRAYLAPRIDDHLAWIKSDLLPETHQLIGELITRIEKGLGDDDITWVEGRIEYLRTKLNQRIIPDAVWLLSNLSADQVKYMQEEFSEDMEKDLKKVNSKTPEEFKKERLKRYEKTFTDWVGSISDSQKINLQEIYGDLASLEHRKIYLVGRSEVQAKFVKLTTSPVNEIALREFIVTWIENPAELRTGASKEHYLKRSKLFRDSLLKLQETFSADQRKALVETLKDHRQNILTFSRSKT